MIRKLIAAIILIHLFNLSCKGQEMIGLSLGNFAGIDGVSINPSSISFSKSRMEVRIFGNHTFLDNNMYYIPRSDNKGLGFISKPLPKYGDENDKNFLYYTNKGHKSLYLNQHVLAPAFMINIRDHTFGFSISARAYGSSQDIPYEIPVIAYEGIKKDILHNIRFNDFGFNAKMQAWAEYALSYSYLFHSRYDERIAAGINFKILRGLSALYTEF